MSSRKGEMPTPACLQLQLKRQRAAEEQRAGHATQRVPHGEDHQRHGDEAAPFVMPSTQLCV